MPPAHSWRHFTSWKKCPNLSCTRRFNSEKGVRAHLNHPLSTCHAWFQLSSGQDKDLSSDTSSPGNASSDCSSPGGTEPPDLHHEYFENAGKTYGKGQNLFESITFNHEYSAERERNPFYPFSCFEDWEVARWLSHLNIPMYAVDQFFKLKYASLI